MQLNNKLITGFLLLSGTLAVLLSYRFESQFQNLPLFNAIIAQRQEARQEAKIHRLNLYMVRDYHSFLKPLLKSDNIDNSDYIQYFKLISEYLPDRADGYGLLGYSYAREHNIPKALENYEKALVLDPHFFWSYYNLGLLLWTSGDPNHAYMVFQKSLALPPKETLSSILSSKVYMDVLGGAPAQYNVVENLKQGYERTLVFMHHIAIGQAAPEISVSVQAL